MKDFYEYKLLMWYPGLKKSVEKGAIATYNAQENAYQINLSSGIMLIDADEVESNPDFWEMIAGTTFVDDLINEPMHAHENSKQKPLFVTEDGVDVHCRDWELFGVEVSTFKRAVVTSKSLNRHSFLLFANKHKADEYIWKSKKQFSYTDIIDYLERIALPTSSSKMKEAFKNSAIERSKQ